ncbi:MAG TPA: hypothetical protein VJT09_04670 [Pyrinomonadaceae bacterium]|nr:hypothetical protein [Pyrinomonadaceae bacterium]
MKKSEFREKVDEILVIDVDGLGWDEKISIVRQRIIEAEKSSNFDTANSGESWTDEELRIILKTAPTKENCILLARAFRRGYGSIEQIFRWVAEDQASVDQKRPTDSFIKQIKRIAKEVGWRAT